MKRPEDVSTDEMFAAVRKLAADAHFKALRTAEERTAYIHKLLGVERKAVDGLGAPVMEIDPVIYHTAARIEANSKGEAQYGVWKDKAWVKRMREEGAITQVRSKGVQDIQVGFTKQLAQGWEQQTAVDTVSSGGPSQPRFHKVYS